MNLEEFFKIAWFLKIQIRIQKHSIGYACTCNSRRTIFHAGTHNAIQARANNNKKMLFTQILTLNPCMIQKLFFSYLCTCNYKNKNVCYNNTYTVILQSVFRRQINLYFFILNCWKASIMGGDLNDYTVDALFSATCV
jgi:hypothetical protein